MAYQIAHILFTHREIEDSYTDTTKQQAFDNAKLALDRINDGTAFEIVASQVSDCPSGALGGLLGEVEKGEMVEEFDEIAFNLNEGEVSDILETEYGYHIIWRYNNELLDEAFREREE